MPSTNTGPHPKYVRISTVKYHMRRLDLTHQELADALGISSSNVSRWLRYPTLCPSFGVGMALAEVLGVPPQDLFQPVPEAERLDLRTRRRLPRLDTRRIRERMAALVINQSTLAYLMGVDESTVSRWLSGNEGHRREMGERHRKLLASILKCKLNDLYWEDTP